MVTTHEKNIFSDDTTIFVTARHDESMLSARKKNVFHTKFMYYGTIHQEKKTRRSAKIDQNRSKSVKISRFRLNDGYLTYFAFLNERKAQPRTN